MINIVHHLWPRQSGKTHEINRMFDSRSGDVIVSYSAKASRLFKPKRVKIHSKFYDAFSAISVNRANVADDITSTLFIDEYLLMGYDKHMELAKMIRTHSNRNIEIHAFSTPEMECDALTLVVGKLYYQQKSVIDIVIKLEPVLKFLYRKELHETMVQQMIENSRIYYNQLLIPTQNIKLDIHKVKMDPLLSPTPNPMLWLNMITS